MRNKEDQGYRNPAYIYDEGRAGGGPDSRSGSSTSSKSSMKIISTKLKGQGRRRWLTLALIVFIAVVIIIAVTTAVYFTRNNNKGSSSDQTGELRAQQNDTTVITTHVPTTTSETTTTTIKTTTTKPSTTTSITTTATTTTTTTATTTTRTTATTTATTTTTTTTRTTTTQATPKQPATSETVNDTTTSVSKSILTSTDMTPSLTTNKTTLDVTKTSPVTTTMPVNTTMSATSEAISQRPSNLSATMSSILYHPDEVKSITLKCQGRHQGDWRTLTIRRQFKDGYEPVAVAVLNDGNEVEVFKFYPNVSHLIDIKEFDVTLTLTFDPFLCEELTNFTCALANLQETASARANISIYMPEPVIRLPHSIVEDKKVVLRCVTEVWGSSAKVVWRFKPEYNTNFMDFSVEPVNNITRKNCTTVINSTLEFNPTMYEDGADFRCEIRDHVFHPQVIQKVHSDIKLKVVPSNFCEGKRQFTIHPHPHGPCTLVVYCLDTGPLVYEIECEPGHCYDYVKTACVPADSI